MTEVGSAFRWAAALLGAVGVAAAAGSSIGACTSGITADCSDAQCVAVVDAQTESGDDGTSYANESGAETGADEGSTEAGGTGADGGSTDSSDAGSRGDGGSSGDTGANDGGPRDATADG